MADPADELYALPPEDFVAARDALAKAAPADDRAAIKSLRRPTVAGWLANQLVRRSAPQVEALLDVGARLRAAQAGGRGDELRTLATERRTATQALLTTARAIAAESGRPLTADLQSAVAGTLDAAVADGALAAELRAGRLTDALTYAGFGASALSGVPTTAGSSAPSRPTARAAKKAAASTAPAKARADDAQAKVTARERAAQQRVEEAAQRRRHEAEAALATARQDRHTAEERLRLAEHALSDARM